MCGPYGWSRSSHNGFGGQGGGGGGGGTEVGPGRQGTSLGAELQAGFRGSGYTQS